MDKSRWRAREATCFFRGFLGLGVFPFPGAVISVSTGGITFWVDMMLTFLATDTSSWCACSLSRHLSFLHCIFALVRILPIVWIASLRPSRLCRVEAYEGRTVLL